MIQYYFASILIRIVNFEYLRNKIIEIINSCENIKYSDIAVLSPQTNLIKPYLRYIFNNELINGEKDTLFFYDEDNHDFFRHL